MRYRTNAPVSAKALADLREAVGWNRMEAEYSDPRLTSYCHIAVYDGGRLVGWIDCVSNGVTDAYIQDLMVHPACQGQGIGTGLMRRMLAYLREKRIFMVSVIYEESLKAFYARFGFWPMLAGQLETNADPIPPADRNEG